jgi:translation initiation factor IF-3
MFRGRESAHPELGKKILDRIVERLMDVAKVESAAKLDGRNMIMVLGPEKKTKAKVESAKEAPQAEVVPSISAEVSIEES